MIAVGIASANQLSVSAQSQLPSILGAVRSYFRPLTLTFIQKKIVDHEITEARSVLSCQGTIQPFAPYKLSLKPEGQRSWNWQMLHTSPEVALKNDEEFTIRGIRYRVMAQSDWSEYGYILYELVQDYNG